MFCSSNCFLCTSRYTSCLNNTWLACWCPSKGFLWLEKKLRPVTQKFKDTVIQSSAQIDSQTSVEQKLTVSLKSVATNSSCRTTDTCHCRYSIMSTVVLIYNSHFRFREYCITLTVFGHCFLSHPV